MSRRRRNSTGQHANDNVEPWEIKEIIQQYRSRAVQLRDMAGQPGRSKKEISTLLGDAIELNARADKLEATLDPKPSSRRERFADDFDDNEVDGIVSQSGPRSRRPLRQSRSKTVSIVTGLRSSVPRDPRTGRFVKMTYQ